MSIYDLAYEIAQGLIETGIEGGFDAVSCSTAGDYPSIGVSQWEGPRADYLLEKIEGGDKFIGRSYSEIEEAGELEELSELLSSSCGQQEQIKLLAEDCIVYVFALQDVGLYDDRCIIYAGLWCPTSHYVVSSFVGANSELNVNDLDTLYDIFHTAYAYYRMRP